MKQNLNNRASDLAAISLRDNIKPETIFVIAQAKGVPLTSQEKDEFWQVRRFLRNSKSRAMGW